MLEEFENARKPKLTWKVRQSKLYARGEWKNGSKAHHETYDGKKKSTIVLKAIASYDL